MSKTSEILNLSYLLDQEKEAILAVLKRDENLKKIEDKRVRRLKNELLEIKKKGAKIHRLRQNSAKICVRCQKALGLIFDRGDICPACQFRVCKACRVPVKEGVWKCTVCAKITQIRIATGDWFFEERAKRFKSSTVQGSEVVRKSIMRKFSVAAKRGEEAEKSSIDIKENTPVPALLESDTSGKRSQTPDKKTSQHSGKSEDGRSIHSNYDAQSLRSTRSLPRANGPDRRLGKQTRSGEDAVSIHSNHDAQSLRSISSIPRSERRSMHSLPEASQAEFLQNKDNVDEISQASIKIDSRSESRRSSPISARESVHSFDPSGSNNSQTAAQSNSPRTSTSAVVHQSSPTPSKRSVTSNYSHTSIGSAMKTSSSIPEDIAKRHKRSGSGTPSLALSRVSIASDHSRSELDLSRQITEGNGDTGSIRSRSVPGGLNTNLDYLDENEEDFIESATHHPASLRSGYSVNAQPVSDRKWTHLNVPDADADTTSINSMTSAYSEIWDYDNVKVSGEITLNLNYSYKTGALNVLVKSCKKLAVADEKKNRTDPYVKAYLLPDKSRQSKRKTKIKTNTTNPEFNEVLKYVISHTQLETRTLHLSVWHNDRFGHNSFLGEVNIPLDTWNFESQEDECFTLQPKMDSTSEVTLQYKGEIIIGLRYIPPEKNLTLPLEPVTTGKKSFKRSKKVPMPTGGILEVLVKEAKNLTAVKSGGTSDTFVKGYLLPDNNKSTKHKTPIIKKSVNPQWNHTFSFTNLQPNDLQNVCLELTVWDKESLSSNIFLGGVCLGCGSGTSYGNEVAWMDAQGEEKYLWQKMMDDPGNTVEGTLMLRSTMSRRKNTNQSS
ncbi:synaptotagmin-like protein 5 isoform X3 [Hyla sarda]|uniref:synaptotagmin-like protein 5 isoform X3 n=1 Tax=Hyla sarda TaxID=327740 RepID=UPI0024C4397F|nr:synaptotagmin-like protein 5 isoform X3 [Hyla sarda]